MTSRSPPRTMTGRRRGPSGGGLCRERGQLKLSSLDPVSTRAVNFQHKSMRNFLRSRPGDPSPTNSSNSSNNNNNNKINDINITRTSILSPTEAGTELIKKRIRISLTKSDTSDRSLELGLALVPPKRLESSMTPSDIRQILDQKVELSRQHDKKDHEMSLRWGSLNFKLYEEETIRAPMRTSELSDSQEEILAIEEFMNSMGENDDIHGKEEESEYNNNHSTTTEAKEKTTTTNATTKTPPAVDTSTEFLASNPPDFCACTSDIIHDNTVEVAPGVYLPLKTPMQTWAAVEEGRVTVTTCNQCKVELTCTDDAHMVMCVDCWVFSPVDQAAFHDDLTASQSLNYKNMENGCVSVGISTEEIFEWITIQEAAELMGG